MNDSTLLNKALNAKKHHKDRIYVPGMNHACSYSAYNETAYLKAGSNPNVLWENTWMAKYYGLKRVYVDNEVPIKKTPLNLRKLPS